MFSSGKKLSKKNYGHLDYIQLSITDHIQRLMVHSNGFFMQALKYLCLL